MEILRTALLSSFLVVWSLFAPSLIGSAAFAQQDSQGMDFDSQAKPSAGIPPQPNSEEDRTSDSDRPLEQPELSGPAGQANVPPPPAGHEMNDSSQTDPPGRAARLQYLSGAVSVQPHGTDDWVEGALNRPLTIGDNVWADKNSRAELNVGTGLIRINSETSLTLTNVSDNSVQLSLHQGTMNLHVRHLFDGEIYEVDTPNQAFTVLKPGDYRFDVDPNGDSTVVTVRHGEGEATGQGPSVRVKSNEEARFTGGNSLTHETHKAPSPDGFDDWCQVRDHREDNALSARYVSPDVVGSEDLDAYGTWRTTPEYGPVWVPSGVAPGWAPYSSGHWVWIDPWGWTWVDDTPWGYAPFHYGRWVSFGGYWGWAPGPYYGGWHRGYYAPALVAWYGGGGWGVGFGFGFGGGYGWCPLGFGEPFFPWYRAGWGYFGRVNIYNTRIVNINGFRGGFHNGYFENRGGFRYANMNSRGFTAVSRGTLERGLPVHQNAVRLNESQIRSAPAANRINAHATRESRLGPNAGRPVAAAPSRAFSRPVTSRMRPPAASRNAVAPSRFAGNQNNAARSGSAKSNVPRPPQNFQRSVASGANSNNAGRQAMNSPSGSRNVPRPPASVSNRTAESGVQRSSSQSSNFARGGSSGSNNVPRPTGRVLPAPRQYSSPSSSGRSNYSGSYGNSGRYSSSSRYTSSPYAGRSYAQSSGGSSTYSRSAPSYSGRSYAQSSGGSSAYSRSAPSYSGRSYAGSSSGDRFSSYGGGSSHQSSGGGSSHGSSGRSGGRR